LGFDAADGDGVVPLRKYPSFRVALSPAIGSAGLARFFLGLMRCCASVKPPLGQVFGRDGFSVTQVSWNEFWNGKELKGVLLAGNCQDKPKRSVPPPKEGSHCFISFLQASHDLTSSDMPTTFVSFYLSN
jgi:hypothetical protein